jgi:ecdysteroid kinase
MALRSSGAVRAARVVDVAREPIGEGVGFVGDIARLRLAYDVEDPGAPATVIAKLPTMEPRRRMMSSAARLFEREIHFYHDIAPGIDVLTPRLHFGASSTEDGRHVLLLEDLAPAEPGDQLAGCSVERAEAAVRMVARLHASWWRRDELESLEWMPPLAGVHPSAEAWWDEMWKRCVERAGARMPAAALRVGERIGANAMWAMRQIDSSPHTIVHGDYRLDNLFFGGDDARGEPAVVDWQLSTRGCGVYDLAYLLSGSLAPADRKRCEMELIRAWHEELLALGVRDYSYVAAVRDYRLSVVVCLTFVTVMLNVVESADPRALGLVDVVLERSAAAVADLEVEELLPRG